MKNFNWEEFKKGKLAVHCLTKEIAEDFLKECKKKGFVWQISGKSPLYGAEDIIYDQFK